MVGSCDSAELYDFMGFFCVDLHGVNIRGSCVDSACSCCRKSQFLAELSWLQVGGMLEIVPALICTASETAEYKLPYVLYVCMCTQ